MTGAGGTRLPRAGTATTWDMGDFIADVVPGAASAAVLVGTPGPAQKITAQVRDASGRVGAYLKFGRTQAACRRLANERRVLDGLPADLGPRVLKYGEWRDGVALVLSALPGEPPPVTLPPPSSLRSYCARLISAGRTKPIDDHPWTAQLADRDPIAGSLLDPLRGKAMADLRLSRRLRSLEPAGGYG